ncbi:MAG TPA: M1 family metallopeptidase [Pseudosphingobacterium sp.]|nr:M1 family metallopeptidase [Pseudosphingobacterium sp.]
MKFIRQVLLFFIHIFIVATAIAQIQLPLDASFKQAVRNNTRTMEGIPGSRYWQNKADYKLKIDFEPRTRLLEGTVEIVYKNNSPDTLHEIWFKLYPNLYKKGVLRKSKIARRDLGNGVQIKRAEADGDRLRLSDLIIDGTNMKIAIEGLMPGKEMTFNIGYQYVLNEGSHLRTGKVDESSFFVAYFFPRIAVYDDIDGWNKYPYTGEEEFYNDFCDFKAEIKVPRNYTVWATGDLTNKRKVFKSYINDLIDKAEKSDTIIDVISEKAIKSHDVVREKSNVFKFEAKNVVDFAFALSDHYVWKSTSLVVDSVTGRRTRVDAVFNSKHKDYYEVIDFARKTVEGMSFKFPSWPFPYNHMTVFDGLDQMEYPMMANDNPTKTREDGITLTSHEIFHTMFPFYMGTNETKYAWMDEGWATIGEWKLSSFIDSAFIDDYGIQPTARTSGHEDDTPIMTLTTALKGAGTFTNSYPKPALGYLFVEEFLGEKLFKTALHYYIKNWNGKHPQPLDFFNCINYASGKDLNWFWKKWFFEDGITDMGIIGVEKIDEQSYLIKVKNKSNKPLPVHLTVYFDDGTFKSVKRSIVVWEKGQNQISIPFSTEKRLVKVVLGGTHIPDQYEKDNSFILN